MPITPSAARVARTLSVPLLGLLLLVGCGGGGGGAASLTVEIVGLPEGLDGDVRVSGEGITRTLTATRTLSLPQGSYGLEARPVERALAPIVSGETYAATLTSSQVALAGTAAVRASYRATSGAVLLVPSYDVRSDQPSLRILSVQDLAAGEHAGRGALAGDRRLTAAAVEPYGEGRVLLSNADTATVRIAVVDADGASPLASFSRSGGTSDAPLALAFAPEGDLWLLSGGDAPTLHRFARGDVQGVVAVGTVLTPQASLALPPNGAGAPVDERADIVTLLVDQADRLWVIDERGDRVVRYDGASALGGAAAPTIIRHGLPGPTSLVVDDADRAYLATAGGVRRYDDAIALASSSVMPLPIPSDDRPEMLALDASGALWVGTARGRLLRVLEPHGAAQVERTLRWTLASDVSTPAFGGNALFVPPLDR